MQKGKTSFRRVWGAGAQKKSKVKSVTGRNGHCIVFVRLDMCVLCWVYCSTVQAPLCRLPLRALQLLGHHLTYKDICAMRYVFTPTIVCNGRSEMIPVMALPPQVGTAQVQTPWDPI